MAELENVDAVGQALPPSVWCAIKEAVVITYREAVQAIVVMAYLFYKEKEKYWDDNAKRHAHGLETL